MMQVPKRKTSTTNEAHPHSPDVCIHWCVFSFKKLKSLNCSVAQLELSQYDFFFKAKSSYLWSHYLWGPFFYLKDLSQ